MHYCDMNVTRSTKDRKGSRIAMVGDYRFLIFKLQIAKFSPKATIVIK